MLGFQHLHCKPFILSHVVSYAFLSSLSVYILWRAVVNSQVVIFLGFGTVYSMSIVTAYKTVQVCAANIYHTNLRYNY